MIKDAYRFAVPPLIAGLLCFIPGWKFFGAVLIFLGLFVFYFFRDPQRVIPTTPGHHHFTRRMAASSKSWTKCWTP